MSRGLCCGVLAALWSTAVYATDVDFSLLPPVGPVAVDTVFLAPMHISTSSDANQSIAGIRLLLHWDPDNFALLGVRNDGPYSWLLSRFPDDSGLDGLNNTWNDGDAKYEALASLGNPALATPAGLHVATLEFRALRPVVAGPISVPAALGQWSRSQVFGADEPNQDVTGTLNGMVVTVVPEPGGALSLALVLWFVIGMRK